jgi:hypothetical protein
MKDLKNTSKIILDKVSKEHEPNYELIKFSKSLSIIYKHS